MDIREWLQNTADREPPDQQHLPGFPEFFQPQRDAAQSAHKHHRKRKKAMSEHPSSERRLSTDRRRQAAMHSSSSEHVRPAGAAHSRSSRSSQSNYESVPSGHERLPIRTFERRARHKTKPDRYEPKPRKQRKEREFRCESKSKSKRRKWHRSGDGARTAGLVQSFQLKNGPKNNRLTLRPDISAGIFKHGRSSAPMVASGPGLPDLVFNEMKFLQKPKEHQDELPNEQGAKQPTKKSRKQLQEEEISAYFSRKPIAEHQPERQNERQTDHRLRTQGHADGHDGGIQRSKEPPSAERRPPQPPVDLPEKAFLGFGSRGPPPGSNDAPLKSNSYHTWSESVPAMHSPVPAKDQMRSAGPSAEPQSERSRHTSRVSNRSPPRRKHGDRVGGHVNQVLDVESGQWIQTRRAGGAALVDVDMESKRQKDSGQTPKNDSSELRANQAPVPEVFRSSGQVSPWETGSFHTSDILKIQKTQQGDRRSPSLPRQERCTGGGENQENQDPSSSSPTSKLLREALEGLAKPQQRPLPASQKSKPVPGRKQVRQPTKPQDQTKGLEYTYRPATREALAPKDHMRPKSGPQTWHMPQRGFSRTNYPSRSLQKGSLERTSAMPTYDKHYFQSPETPTTRRSNIFEEAQSDEMLDDLPIAKPLPYVYVSGRQVEEPVRHLAPDQAPAYCQLQAVQSDEKRSFFHHRIAQTGEEPGFLESQIGQTEYLEEFEEPEFQKDTGMEILSNEIPSASVHAYSGQEKYSGEKHVDERQADNMLGFWRPNRLY